VQLQRLRDTAAELAIAEELRQYDVWLGQERQRAQTSLEDAVRSKRFSHLLERFSELDQWAINTDADAPLLEDAPRRLQRAYKALEKSADPLDADAPAPELHQVRIRAKRLRYAAEFFEPAFDSKIARRLIGHCVALQDLLGELQDGVVSSQHVHTAVQTAASAWPVETSLALGQLLQFDKQRGARLRKRFPGAYADVKEDWKRRHRAFRP
jgi:CHAD domain-containing protein